MAIKKPQEGQQDDRLEKGRPIKGYSLQVQRIPRESFRRICFLPCPVHDDSSIKLRRKGASAF